MSAWLPPGLRQVIELRLRAALRDGLERARSPSGALTVVGTLAFLGVWLVPVFFVDLGHRPVSDAWLARVGPLGLLVVWIGQVLVRGGGEVLGFVPSEADQLFGAPFSPEQLLRYKVTLLLIAWSSTAVFLSPMAMFYASHPLGGFLAVLLLLPFLQLSAMVAAMARRGGGRSLARRVAFLAVVVVLGVAAVFLRPGDASEGAWLDALQSHAVAVVLLAPFHAGVRLLTAASPAELALPAATVLAVDAALVAVLLRQGRGAWLEIAVDGAQHVQETVEAYRSGGGVATLGGWWSARVPALPRWGGVGPVAWRRLVGIVRRPVTFAALGGVSLLVAGMGALVPLTLPNVGRTGLALAMMLSGMVWTTVLVPGILRHDFRADLDRMDQLLALPIRPWALVVGQVTPMAALVTVCVWAQLAAVAAWTPAAADEALLLALVQPALAAAVLLVENALFLWFPVRLEAGEAALQSVGRNVLVSLASWMLHGVGITLAAVVGALVVALGAPGLLAGATAALPLAGLAGLGLVAAVLRLRRFDPSVHVPR